MFGDIMGMMGKIKETQKKVEETKERLNHVTVQEASHDGFLKMTMSANRELKSLDISEELFQDKEQLEDYLILHFNKLIKKASDIHESELAAVAKEGMPNIPGLDLFK